jgi:hypothetical protein
MKAAFESEEVRNIVEACAEKRTRNLRDSLSAACYLCGDTEDEVAAALGPTAPALQLEFTWYGSARYCYRCMKQLVLDVIVPTVAAATERSRPAYRAEVEKRVAALKTADTKKSAPPPAPWRCSRCSVRNDDEAATCKACSVAREWLICDDCGADAACFEFCINTGDAEPRPHDVWNCTVCDRRALGGRVCSGCGAGRAWFCGACSMENSPSAAECAACGGAQRMNTLTEYDAMVSSTSAGLGSSSALQHRLDAERGAMARQRVDARLRQLGLVAVPADDNGNCLFDALAFQLTRCRGLRSAVRLMLVEHIINHQQRFADILGDDALPAYVDSMTRDKAWGDEYAVLAAANAFHAHVCIITSIAGRIALNFKPDDQPGGGSANAKGSRGPTPFVVLAFVSQTHYFSAVLPPVDAAEFTVDFSAVVPAPQQQPVQRTTVATGRFAEYELPRLSCSSSTRLQHRERPAFECVTAVTLRVSGGRLLRERLGKPTLATAGDVWYVHPVASPPAVRDLRHSARSFILQHAQRGVVLALPPRRAPTDTDVAVTLLEAVAARPEDCIITEFADHTLAFSGQRGGGLWFIAIAPSRPTVLSAQTVLPRTSLRFALTPLFAGSAKELCVKCGEWADSSSKDGSGGRPGGCSHVSMATMLATVLSSSQR